MSTARREQIRGLTRRIAAALADERVRRHHADEPLATLEEERTLARRVAMEHLSVASPADPWGRPSVPSPDTRALVEEAISGVLGLGRLEPLLEDEDITDIHVRGNSTVWLKMRDGRRESVPAIVDSDEELVELIRRIATRMCVRETRFDPSNPEVNLQLPDGSRMFAAMDISQRPTLVVRRHRFENATLRDLCVGGMMSPETCDFLAACVRARRNIVIAGGTGSGKTTLLRALINEIHPTERIVTIEDSYELGIERMESAHPDHDCLQSRPPNAEGEGEVTLSQLTRMALRMDPDRVIVGEVRGAEAFPMLMAMSQGNNGSMCTMHADTARSVFPKLAAYMSMASTGVPVDTMNLLIASSVHFVVHVRNDDGRRVVESILEVVDAEGSSIVSNDLFSRSTSVPAFASMRSGTAALLADHGFRARRELSWA
ncbi:MAG: CpaF family protein [Ilumatobacteraceae bacterium]